MFTNRLKIRVGKNFESLIVFGMLFAAAAIAVVSKGPTFKKVSAFGRDERLWTFTVFGKPVSRAKNA